MMGHIGQLAVTPGEFDAADGFAAGILSGGRPTPRFNIKKMNCRKKRDEVFVRYLSTL